MASSMEDIKTRIGTSNRAQQAIEEIRDNFTKKDKGYFKRRGLTHESMVTVVDEVNSSGATLAIASAMLELAFPGLKVNGHIWMPARVVQFRDGVGTFQRQMPVWYNDQTSDGRGIGELSDGKLITSSPYGESGINVASSPLSRQMRQDISLLFRELRDPRGNLLFRPSPERENDNYIRALKLLNQGNYLGRLIEEIVDPEEVMIIAASEFSKRGYTTRP